MAETLAKEDTTPQGAKTKENDLFAAIGKQVAGLEIKEGEEEDEDERVKVVNEIESLCMNCQDNVSDHQWPLTLCAANTHGLVFRE